MYLNRVELIGFTGSDAETKTTPQGKTVTTFSIATKTSYIKAPREGAPSKGTERPRDGAQSRKSSTEWTASRPGAGSGKYAAAFKKGSDICVEGELRSREYESNDAKVRTYDIVANSIINLRAGQRYTAQTSDPTEATA